MDDAWGRALRLAGTGATGVSTHDSGTITASGRPPAVGRLAPTQRVITDRFLRMPGCTGQGLRRFNAAAGPEHAPWSACIAGLSSIHC